MNPTETQDSATQVAVSSWRTLDQEAERVQAHVQTLRRACRSGALKHVRLFNRRAIRLKSEWVDAWLLNSSTPIESDNARR